MTDLIPIECEARLMGLSKVDRKDGEWTQLTFQIHPDECPYALFLLPLKTHVMLSIKGTEDTALDAPTAAGDGITDDTAAIQAGAAIGPGQRLPEKPSTADWSEAKRKMVQRSGIVRNEPAFHDYIRAGWPQVWNHPRQNDKTDPERAAYFIHAVCKVDSCRDLDPDGQTGQAFRDLYARYEAAMAGTTPEAQEQQRLDGPG